MSKLQASVSITCKYEYERENKVAVDPARFSRIKGYYEEIVMSTSIHEDVGRDSLDKLLRMRSGLPERMLAQRRTGRLDAHLHTRYLLSNAFSTHAPSQYPHRLRG